MLLRTEHFFFLAQDTLRVLMVPITHSSFFFFLAVMSSSGFSMSHNFLRVNQTIKIGSKCRWFFMQIHFLPFSIPCWEGKRKFICIANHSDFYFCRAMLEHSCRYHQGRIFAREDIFRSFILAKGWREEGRLEQKQERACWRHHRVTDVVIRVATDKGLD